MWKRDVKNALYQSEVGDIYLFIYQSIGHYAQDFEERERRGEELTILIVKVDSSLMLAIAIALSLQDQGHEHLAFAAGCSQGYA